MNGKNTAASVKARLHKLAVQQNKASDLIFLLFAHERFLYRLAQSTYRDYFKGRTVPLFIDEIPNQTYP